MNKTIFSAILFAIASILLSSPAKAAETPEDFRIWTTVNLNVRATKTFHINLAVEGRFYNLLADDIRPEGKEPGLGLLRTKLEGKVKVCKYFSAAAGYTLFYSPMDTKLNANKLYHRVDLEATGLYSFYGLTLSLRERLQTDVKNIPIEGGLTERRDLAFFDIRSCFKISYKIPKSIFSPYVSVEIFNPLNKPNNGKIVPAFITQVRTMVGTTMKFDKNNSLNVFFLAQTFHKEVEAYHSNLVIGVSYTFGCGAK